MIIIYREPLTDVQSLTDVDEINKKLVQFLSQSKTTHPNDELFLNTEFEVFDTELKTNPLYLAQMLIVLTAIGTNYEAFMIRISQADDDIQELWSDIIGRNINMIDSEYQSE